LTYFFAAAVLSTLFEVALWVTFLPCFFTVVFDVLEELCDWTLAGAAAGAVCAAKVKGRLAAVKAIAKKVVFILFLPAGFFSISRSQSYVALLRLKCRYLAQAIKRYEFGAIPIKLY
jgi:hypothetical protein